MGMQIAPILSTFAAIINFLAAHWVGFSCVLAVIVVSEIVWVHQKWPADTTGNGIVIGQAKAFDNRSLALRLERLNAGLEQVKAVNQNVTDNLATFQEQASSNFSRELSLKAKVPAGKNGAADKSGADPDSKKDPKAPASSTPDASSDFKPTFGLGASDLLTNQLNLATQIFNLQTLYERSLSDRMMGAGTRLQTVLGFQISITPPTGYKDCVAMAEIAVRMKPQSAPSPSPPPVSLVALMPQERTYNAESISSSESSIDGSAVANVLTLGFSNKRGSRQLFIHRDSDTVAFEREPQTPPRLLENAIIFGWEFRPVLGRRTVSPGTRQMLAVIAVPEQDAESAAESTIEVATRSYWRRYKRNSQTSAPNWSWVPWKVNGSGMMKSHVQELQIPNTAKIQSALAPKVADIKWVNTGDGKATVIVKGANFFSGTKVLIGGTVKREEDSSLTLKSDQALEFVTSLDELTTGDAVLSGRFGPSFQLVVPDSSRPVAGLAISSAVIRPMRNSKALRVSINIVGMDVNGTYKDFAVMDVVKLPDPILFVGSEAVPMPYDYSDQANDSNASCKYVRVEAWISAKTLAKSPSVAFRVPFCGFDYQASQPLSFSEPTVVRMGHDAQNTVFRIFYPKGLSSPSDFNLELDRTYSSTGPELVLVNPNDSSSPEYRFTVPTDLVSRFQNMVLRIGKAEPYLLPIPAEDKPNRKASVDTNTAPAKVAKGKHGPLEWAGTALDTVIGVTLTQSAPQSASQVNPSAIAQQFTSYANGTRLIVYLSPGTTDVEGKITLECTTSFGDKLNLPLFVTES